MALFFICFALCYCSFVYSGNNCLLDLSSKNWRILSDSGWPGASSGAIEETGKQGPAVKLDYFLEATKEWPWPEIDFFVPLKQVMDFSKFKGVRLDISGEEGNEIYFYFLSLDGNLGSAKPLMHRVLLTGRRQQIDLPFSSFLIARDWYPRNPGYSRIKGWDKIQSFGLHLKGKSGEKGSLCIFKAELLKNDPPEPYSIETMRSAPPEHRSIDFKGNVSGKAEAEIVIDCRPAGKKISPYLFGANWGVWLGLPEKNKAVPLGAKMLRAGGPFMDRFDWSNSRYTFPGSNKEINMTSLDEFILYCRSINAEPLIQVNALGFANDAAALVRYLNKDKGYNVRFFEIGNEPFIWHKTHFDVQKKPVSDEGYFEAFKKIAIALKKAQNEIGTGQEIKIFAPSFTMEDASQSQIAGFLKKCRDFENDASRNPEKIKVLDCLSVHYFPSFIDLGSMQNKENLPYAIESVQNWWNAGYVNSYDSSLPKNASSGLLPKLKKIIDENYPGTELGLTEFGIESQSMVSYAPLTKVIYLADLYGILAREGLDYSMQFCLNSSDQNVALIDDLDNITPLYYPFSLYANNFRGQMLNAITTIPEKLNVYACKNGVGTVIMVVNKERRPYVSAVRIKTKKQAAGFLHRFPALSLTCFNIKEQGSKFSGDCWEYGEKQLN